MNASEYICSMVRDGALSDGYHGGYIECGEDIDENTAHVILRVNTNDCAVLIEVLQRMQPFGVVLVAMHHLHGKFKDCLELDLRLMQRRIRKAKPLDGGVPYGENV